MLGDTENCRPETYLVTDLHEDNGVLSKTTHKADRDSEGTESIKIERSTGRLTRTIHQRVESIKRISWYEGTCTLSGSE